MVVARLAQWISNPESTHRAFDVVARGYDIITGQTTWRASAQRFTAWLPATPTPRVLDLGAGPGNSGLAMLSVRPEARIILLDRAPAMLQRARHTAQTAPQLAPVLADASALPFVDKSFDLVTGHSFLYLVPNRPAVLAEARRVLRPGCYAAFLEPAAGSLGVKQWAQLARGGVRFLISMIGWRLVSGVHIRFTPSSLSATLEAAGFRDARAEITMEGAGVLGAGQRAT
jgi:ubiquinone/menaquinone biosynthesis C-methylase UbiE